MRQSRGVAAEFPLARFTGTRWTIAMGETDWGTFRYEIAPEASERLTAILESFSEHGEGDLPRGSFRWFARTSRDPAGVEMGAFEARGVVLQGRRAIVNGRDAFFITDVLNDASPPAPVKRRKPEVDNRQTQLPLSYGKSRGDG